MGYEFNGEQKTENFIKNQKPFEENDNKFWRENGINIRATGLENLSLMQKSRLLDFLEGLVSLNIPNELNIDGLPSYITKSLHKRDLTQEEKVVLLSLINNLRSLGFTEQQVLNETHESFIDMLHEKGISTLDNLLDVNLDKVNQTAYVNEIINILKHDSELKKYRESEGVVFEPIAKQN